MKVLTIIATIFMPLTVFTGMYGMNVELPHLPGGDARAVLVDSRDHARDVWRHGLFLQAEKMDLADCD